VVRNLDTNRSQTSALVTSSQSATGALQATQAGNQLAALQAQQLADLTAMVDEIAPAAGPDPHYVCWLGAEP
jgi:P-type conjugative transfer protein TrbJ